MLVRALILAAITGVAVASPLRSNNQTEAPSVDLGYEIHTATTNVCKMPRTVKCTRTLLICRTVIWRLSCILQHPVRRSAY